MVLSVQQQTAMGKIEEFISNPSIRVFVLRGYAGTGKTTLISEIVNLLEAKGLISQLMAPTGRAAKVLRSKLNNKQVSTIHRGIYAFQCLLHNKEEKSIKFIYPLRKADFENICIIDEASMISSKVSHAEIYQFGTGNLLSDLIEYAQLKEKGKIIFIGDPMQLPPVGDSKSNALDPDFFNAQDIAATSFELTDVIRQTQESYILTNAMKLRELYKEKIRNSLIFEEREQEFEKMDEDSVVEHMLSHHLEDSTIVCFSNQQASEYNKEIRKKLYPTASHVLSGDKLMVVSNNYFGECELFNGDIVTVVDAADDTVSQSAPVWVDINGEKKRIIVELRFRKVSIQLNTGEILERYIIDSLLENSLPNLTVPEIQALYINLAMRLGALGYKDPDSDVFKKLMLEDPYYNALHVKYGYASTCHKAQGGEWQTVYIDFRKRNGMDNDSLRWKYTAITRARQTLYCVNSMDLTPLTKVKIESISTVGKTAQEALSFHNVADTPFHSPQSLDGVKAKYWSVVNNLEGTLSSIVNVICKPWMDIYMIMTPNGEVRVDALYNSSGVFTKYRVPEGCDYLEEIFKNEENITYRFNYNPKSSFLGLLHSKIVGLCDEYEIVITNIVQHQYQVVYYLKTSAIYSSLTCYYDSKGFIKYIKPMSLIGSEDQRLKKLLDNLN